MTPSISMSHLPGSDKECRDVIYAYVSLWLDWLTSSLRLSSPGGPSVYRPKNQIPGEENELRTPAQAEMEDVLTI